APPMPRGHLSRQWIRGVLAVAHAQQHFVARVVKLGEALEIFLQLVIQAAQRLEDRDRRLYGSPHIARPQESWNTPELEREQNEAEPRRHKQDDTQQKHEKRLTERRYNRDAVL